MSPPRTPGVDRGARGLGASVLGEYDAKLNQTIVDGPVNSNKFYVLQVLQKGSVYACWNRWGRVGEEGVNNEKKLVCVCVCVHIYIYIHIYM
jgi:poly [ADP-ribose] polymerase